MARLAVLLILLTAVLPARALAECAEQAAADECCAQIARTVIELKYEPGCIVPDHKPLATMYPCGDVCIEPRCHEPVLAVHVCEYCLAHIELTGCRCGEVQQECDECGADCGCT